MAWLGDLAAPRRRRDVGSMVRTRATDEAGRLLVDAVGRDLGLDVLERRVEALRIFKGFVHVQYADATVEISRNLAVDRPADAVLDIHRLVERVDVGRAEGLEPVLVRNAKAVGAEACARRRVGGVDGAGRTPRAR